MAVTIKNVNIIKQSRKTKKILFITQLMEDVKKSLIDYYGSIDNPEAKDYLSKFEDLLNNGFDYEKKKNKYVK